MTKSGSEPRDCTAQLRDELTRAAAARQPLAIHGAGTKSFYGRRIEGQAIDLAHHRGIMRYSPSELVITARAGTPLAEIDAALAEGGQHLAFDPPALGAHATLGGTIACGLSGPARPFAGSARDFVLGMTILDGQGEAQHFGGEVMKNVAGYDCARLMTGALGTLGVILDVSLKVLPRPAATATLRLPLAPAPAIAEMNRLAGRHLPLSGACHADDALYLRLAGTPEAVEWSVRELGAPLVPDGDDFWRAVREHTHPFFNEAKPLWRVCVPATAPLPDWPGRWLLDWAGAQRWLVTGEGSAQIREYARRCGGHATCFRGGERDGEVFHPVAPGLDVVHERLKHAFDPHRILNRGRMYSWL